MRCTQEPVVKWELAITTSFCFCNLILSILSCWKLHDKFPTTAFVYIDGHPSSNHSAAVVHYLVYQVDRMYSVVKISHFPSMYIIYNIHAVAILWFINTTGNSNFERCVWIAPASFLFFICHIMQTCNRIVLIGGADKKAPNTSRQP